MDESSRSILKFIAAGTGAILLLMAAWFYIRPQDPKPAAPAPEISKPASEPVAKTQAETNPVAEGEIDNPDDDEGEEIAPIDGKPTRLETPDE